MLDTGGGAGAVSDAWGGVGEREVRGGEWGLE